MRPRLVSTTLVALAVALTSAACSGGRRRLTCERPIKGFKTEPGQILWFGEMHGTEESPRFIGDAVCEAARWDRVQLGLEIPQDEQLRINHYLVDGDRTKLLAGPFWAQHDGRSSTAMLGLLDRVRKIREGGGRVEVVAYDITNEPDRDAAMARTVLASRDPGTVFIGLSGNIHSRRTKWNDMTPLVARLVEQRAPIKTFDVSASGGTMWACMSEPDHEPVCGEHPNSNDGGKGPPWSLGKPRDDSHDGVYFVGPTKAAPPAKP
jgi:hypothetical protein